MTMRTTLVALMAIIFSGSATLGIVLFTRQTAAPASIETVSIVTATVPVARGVTLDADMLRMQDWPAAHLPPTVLESIEDAIGRTVWMPLLEGEPVVEPKLAAKGAGRGMAALVPTGMRAITIQTPNVSTGLAGFILPGNRVDVLWTRSQVGHRDESGGGSTITLLQNIEVLAVDQQLDMPSENRIDARDLRSVTLMVSPADAAKIDLAQNRGTLRLSLRNPADLATDAVETATLIDMLPPGLIVSGPAPPAITGEPEATQAEQETEPRLAVVSADQLSRGGMAGRDPLLQIRTLRGTSSGSVYLRRPVDISAPQAQLHP